MTDFANGSRYAQMPLALALREDVGFSSFWPGPNGEVVAMLETLDDSARVFLWGAPGSGKSHLLQAACQRLTAHGARALYLPLDQVASPAALQDLRGIDAVCVDSLETAVADPDWERALYDLYNRCLEQNIALVIAASKAPDGLGLGLPDLRSRLQAMTLLHLVEPEDEDKAVILRRFAGQRGLELTPDLSRYLLTHGPRDLPSLFAEVVALDNAAMAAKRRPSLSILKDVLARGVLVIGPA